MVSKPGLLHWLRCYRASEPLPGGKPRKRHFHTAWTSPESCRKRSLVTSFAPTVRPALMINLSKGSRTPEWAANKDVTTSGFQNDKRMVRRRLWIGTARALLAHGTSPLAREIHQSGARYLAATPRKMRTVVHPRMGCSRTAGPQRKLLTALNSAANMRTKRSFLRR
jgi:hypothetical protein